MGIWTVEQGETRAQLHINILADATASGALPGCDTWQHRYITEHRRVAAYISKIGQAPEPSAYGGPTTGRLGPMWRHLATNSTSPTLRGVALQLAIDPTPLHQPPPPQWSPGQMAAPPAPPDYRAIAAKYMPDLISKIRPSHE